MSATGSKPQTPRKRRQYMPAEERRRHILEATREVFARLGLKGARTRELAQAAGINQATLFEHFKSKEELFIAAVVEPLEALMEGSRERALELAKAGSMDDRMSLSQQGFKVHLESMLETYPLLVQALFSDRELGEKLYREQIVPLLQARAETMQDFVKEGLDPHLVQVASFGMIFAVAMDAAMTDTTPDLANISRQLTDLITLGCARNPEKE